MTFKQANELYHSKRVPFHFQDAEKVRNEYFFKYEPRVHVCKTCTNSKECYVKKDSPKEVVKCNFYKERS